jgi:hypothetical protein
MDATPILKLLERAPGQRITFGCSVLLGLPLPAQVRPGALVTLRDGKVEILVRVTLESGGKLVGRIKAFAGPNGAQYLGRRLGDLLGFSEAHVFVCLY